MHFASCHTIKRKIYQNILTSISLEEKNQFFETTGMFPEEHMLEIMSTCHSLTIIDGKLVGMTTFGYIVYNSYSR